ncbi:ABC transporter ATP-binding protein, partial [Streptococcus suis]
LSLMISLAAKLTFLIVLFLALIFFLVDQYRYRSAPIGAKSRSLLSAINSFLAVCIEGIRFLLAFSVDERLKDVFESINV